MPRSPRLRLSSTHLFPLLHTATGHQLPLALFPLQTETIYCKTQTDHFGPMQSNKQCGRIAESKRVGVAQESCIKCSGFPIDMQNGQTVVNNACLAASLGHAARSSATNGYHVMTMIKFRMVLNPQENGLFGTQIAWESDGKKLHEVTHNQKGPCRPPAEDSGLLAPEG